MATDFSPTPLWSTALVGPLSVGNVTKSCNLSLSDPSATSDKTSDLPTLLCQHFRNEKRTYKSTKYMAFIPHICNFSPQVKFVAEFSPHKKIKWAQDYSPRSVNSKSPLGKSDQKWPHYRGFQATNPQKLNPFGALRTSNISQGLWSPHHL